MSVNTSQKVTNTTSIVHVPWPWAILLTSLGSLIIICTLTGNVLVCLAVLLVRKLREPGNYLLVSLAVADFCVGCFVMPIGLVYLISGSWKFGEIICNFWTSADVTLCTASILNLCAISVDRYWAITKPLTYAASQRTTKRILGYIGLVWLTALLISVGPLFAFQTPIPPGECQVSQNIIYQIYATMGSFYVPCVIMLVVNYKILRAAQRLTRNDMNTAVSLAQNLNSCTGDHETQGTNCFNSNDNIEAHQLADRQNSGPMGPVRQVFSHRLSQIFTFRFQARSHYHWFRHESKALKTLGLIMGAFITCWLPFFVLALIKPFCDKINRCHIPRWLDIFVLWLGYMSSLINPLIYAKYNREFRIPFREMLCCRFSTLQTVLRSEMFSAKYGPPVPEQPEQETSRLRVNHKASF